MIEKEPDEDLGAGAELTEYYSIRSGIRIGKKNNTSTANSVYSHSRIVSTECVPHV